MTTVGSGVVGSGLSPTESSGGKSSEKNSDPTDTHSEASSASPQRSDAAEDLSLKPKAHPPSWSESEGLEAKCGECGCLFETQDMLQIHVQETHMFQGGESAHFLPHHLPMKGMGEMGLDKRPHDHDAIASLLALHAKKESEGISPDKSGKVFNPEAYCELCNKEFCNKYYLATHRASKHGAELGMDSPHGLLDSRSNSFSAAPHGHTPSPATGGFLSEKNGTEKCTLPTIPGADENRCPYCSQLLESPSAVQNHILNSHCPPPNMQSLQALYAAQLMGQNAPSPFGQLFGQDKLKLLGDTSQASQMGSLSPGVMALAAMSDGGLGALLGGGKTEDLEAYLNALQQQSFQADLSAFLNNSMPASPGQGPSNNSGVVNPEAYCELCRKEFCNKYFLRTHKAKKHGIIVEDSPGSLKRGRPSISSQSPESLPRQADFQHASVIQSLFSSPHQDKSGEPLRKRIELDQNAATPPATSKADFACPLCPAAFPQYIGLVTHQYQEHGELALGANLLPNGNTTPSKPTAPGPDPEAFCELCQKEFCSKYFLRQHKANIHGIHIPDDSTPPSSCTTPASSLMSPTKRATPVSTSFAFPPSHHMSLFGKEGSPLFSSQLPPTMVPQGLPSTPSSASKPRYSTGKNFCDICNKEVCNKYFLRTHMLKMHGIVIDEHKTVIGNINTLDKEKTGTLIFRCDICSKELRSREFLRQHKQEVHGVLPRSMPTAPPPPPPVQPKAPLSAQLSNSSSSGSDQYRLHPPPTAMPQPPTDASLLLLCPFCETKARDTKQLQAHILKECPHRALLAGARKAQPSENSSPSLSQTSDLSSANDAAEVAKCEFCDERFPDLVQRQLHVLSAHAHQIRALADQASLAALNFLPPKAPSTTDTPESEGSLKSLEEAMKVYRCTLCPYATKWPSNLAAHKRRHEEDPDKPYACSVCARAYRDAHTLQRHRECHKLANANPDLSLKYGASPQKDDPAAKRFRCTQCEKVFKSRDQCRAHLFAAHRRHASPPQDIETEETGWAEPASPSGKPHIVQMFRVESGDARFGRLNLYLPVARALEEPLALNLTLTPLRPHQSRIQTL